MKDYYKILGVTRTSSKEEIKKSYRKLALQYHPDRNKDPSADIIIKDLNEAYDVLGDDVRRGNYHFRLDNKKSTNYRTTTNTHTYTRTRPKPPVQKTYYKKKPTVFPFKEWAHKAKFVSAFILLYCGLLSIDYLIAVEYENVKPDYMEMTLHRQLRRTTAPQRDYYIESPTLKFSVSIETLSIKEGDNLKVLITPLFGIVKECSVLENKRYEPLTVISIYSALYFFVVAAIVLGTLAHLTKSSEQSVTFTAGSVFFFIIILFI